MRELTPALIQGKRGSAAVLREGELVEGLSGTLLHHVFADGTRRRESTIVVTEVREGMAFAPALVCRDRRELGGGAPAQLPAERWQRTELESVAFNDRYRLLALAGQDPIFVRELFSPALIAWLAHDVPAGFSFELNERHLVVALPGHLDDEGEIERLCALAAEVSRRIRDEALEEGEASGLFDESEKRRAIEAALKKAHFDQPPASVEAAMDGFRHAARWRPTVVLSGIAWAIGLSLVTLLVVSLLFNPVFGVFAALAAIPNGFGIGRLIASSRYSWGAVSVSRLGLEAFVAEYARANELTPRDRWRFHSRHRRLPLPGVAGHVLDGPTPGTDLACSFVTLGDAAELRSRGEEIAWTTDRPLASLALVAELADSASAVALSALELPEGYGVERAGSTVAIWKPETGSLCFTAAGFDRFRERAGALIAQVSEHREDAPVSTVLA